MHLWITFFCSGSDESESFEKTFCPAVLEIMPITDKLVSYVTAKQLASKSETCPSQLTSTSSTSSVGLCRKSQKYNGCSDYDTHCWIRNIISSAVA